jgi:IS30 family transposase|tara:strand:+ start:1646 stop:1843 length:198 start_codon:yes stop_codon:yes gene_type:complete
VGRAITQEQRPPNHLKNQKNGAGERYAQSGKNQWDVSMAIGFSQSTTSKELKRNRGQRGYWHQQA